MKYICGIKRNGDQYEACNQEFSDFAVLLLHVRDNHARQEQERFRILDHYVDLELEREEFSTQ